MTTAVAGGDTDGWNNYWNFWWTPFAIFSLHQSPFHTNWIFYQSGTSLYFHTLQPLNGIISAPFQIFGAAFAENTITLLSYLLTAFATYLLAHLLLQNYLAWRLEEINPTPTEDSGEQGGISQVPTEANVNSSPFTAYSLLIELGAFVAGFSFAFASPWRVQYLYGGQVNRLSIEWVPLFLYFAYRAYLRQSWRDALFAALCIVAAALTELQYVVYIALFIVILLIIEVIVRGWRNWLPPALRVIAAGGLALVLLSPMLITMLRELRANPLLAPSQGETLFHSADLLELFAPNRTNLLWGGLANHLNLSVYSKYLVSGVLSPPYIIVILAIVGLVLAWRWSQTRVLFVSLLVFLLISFGPLLHINGREAFTAFGGNILMPYAFLYYLPFMNVSRDPERFGEMAFLFWSLLAALGCFVVAQRYLTVRSAPTPSASDAPQAANTAALRSRQGAAWSLAVGFGLVLLLAGIEFVKVTPPITNRNAPPFYQQLAQDKGQYAIMELPIFKGGDEDQWFSYQAIHHKYLFGGDLARKQAYPFVQYTPVLNWFWAQQLPGADIVPNPPLSSAFEVLRWANTRYVVLIKQPVANQQLASAQRLVAALWGANASPVYSDSIMSAYEVPSTTITATTTLTPLLAVGDGWYDFEADASGGHRWISGERGNRAASIAILDLAAAGNYTLTFRAFSYSHPYQVNVIYLDHIISTLNITPTPQNFNIPLAIVPNRYPLTFQLLGDPTSATSTSGGQDTRFLSVGFGNFSLSH